MERILNPYDKESMRMAMLKHEETFKEQVFELHRLYRIQKMLMKNMKRSEKNEISPSPVNYINKERQKIRKNLDLERPAEEYAKDESGNGDLEIEEESDIELTLGPSRFRRRKKEETPLYSDTGPSFSSSSTDSSFILKTTTTYRRDDEQDLSGQHEWELLTQVPNIHPSFQTGKNSFDVDEQLRQEKLNRPPWLFQVLSLNIS